jgi:hypothetical protein
MALNAQKVYVENFATAPINGNLEGWNGWFKCFKPADALGASPKIAEGALFYTGYIGTNIGNVAVLDSTQGPTASNQEISTHWVVFTPGDTLRPIEGQKIYAAFMINFSSHSYHSERDFFTFEGSRGTGSSSTRGRFFAKLNTAGTDLTFAVSKNSSSAGGYTEFGPIVNGVGINHLLVCCLEGITGATNDIASMYIDPDLSLPEAQQTNKIVAPDNTTIADYAITVPIGINLRQRATGAQIGGIRVGTSWDSVLLGIGAIYSGLSQVKGNNNNIFAFGKTIITNESGSLKVFNLAGAEMMNAKTTGKLETSLQKGLYLVRLTSSNGQVTNGKVQIK